MMSFLSLAASFNQPRFCPNASWNPNATTFANSTIVANGVQALAINTDNTIFVARRDTGSILIWLNGNSTPTTTILANVTTTSCLFVTADDQIVVDSQCPKNRVETWATNQTKLSSTMFLGPYCAGLFVDTKNNLYCSNDQQHHVQRKSLSDPVNTLTIVGGTGVGGSDADMLNHPNGIFVTTNLDLYVADFDNHRIQRFRSGELNATTVAGGAAAIGNISLNKPAGIILDGDGYLFIVDGDNHRIVGSGPYGFRCVAGCSGSPGSTSYQLQNPFGLSFDRGGNMFVTDRGNNRIQKFLLSSDSCSKWSSIVVVLSNSCKLSILLPC